MIGADKAEQGKEPELPLALPSVEPPADHVRSKPFTSVFLLYGCLVGLIWTIVLLVIIAVKTSVASTVVATLGGAVAAITAIIGVFQPPKLPTIGPKATRGIVAFILIVDFVGTVVWGGWSLYVASQPTNVLSVVTLGQNTNVLPGGHATLDVAITAQKNTLELRFQVADHNGEIGSCVPSTLFSVETEMAGNHGGAVPASPGALTLVYVPAGTTKLHLDIAVMNTRDDRNCGVDLSVVSAMLQNE
ncbi:MAG: hypothetical protein ABIZ05_17420 [Pseudonocardiaceae bacterium]